MPLLKSTSMWKSVPLIVTSIGSFCTMPPVSVASQSSWKLIQGTIKCFLDMTWLFQPGLGSIPFFHFNSNYNSIRFNCNYNYNSTTHNKFQFQLRFQKFQFLLKYWPVDVFLEIGYNYDNMVNVCRIIIVNTISLKSLLLHCIMVDPISIA